MASACKIEIDPGSGFCHGVVRAVNKAEEILSQGGRLYSLGAMVHNTAELRRLAGKGLEIIDLEEMRRLPAGSTVLIRAHGEPPATYTLAKSLGIRLVDCTCPVVLKLQKDIAAAFAKVSADGGKVVIFGKRGHAEVNGLVGQTDGRAVVIENLSELDGLDLGGHIELFSQTTRDPEEYAALTKALQEKNSDVTVHDTICRQVVGRRRKLAEFASSHDAILFVSGRDSSNGKVLYELCREHNKHTFRVEDPSEFSPDRLSEASSIGITGATSTPRWQMEAIAARLGLEPFHKSPSQ